MSKPKMDTNLATVSRGLLSLGSWALSDKADSTRKQKFYDVVEAAEGILQGIFNYDDEEPSGELDHSVVELRDDWQRFDELDADPQIDTIIATDLDDRTPEQKALLAEYNQLQTRFGL